MFIQIMYDRQTPNTIKALRIETNVDRRNNKRDISQCFTQDVVTAQRALDVKVTFETVLMRDANHVYLEEYGKVSLNYS